MASANIKAKDGVITQGGGNGDGVTWTDSGDIKKL